MGFFAHASKFSDAVTRGEVLAPAKSMAEMQQVMQEAVEAGVKAIITTEKDAVKIPAEFIHSDRPLPVYILGIELRFMDGCYEQLLELIRRVVEGEKREV